MAESEFGVGRAGGPLPPSTTPRESEMETAAGRSFHEQQNSVDAAARDSAIAAPSSGVAAQGRRIHTLDQRLSISYKISVWGKLPEQLFFYTTFSRRFTIFD